MIRQRIEQNPPHDGQDAEQQWDGHGPPRGADLRYDIEITFKDVLNGHERQINFTRLARCIACRGTGSYLIEGAAPASLARLVPVGQARDRLPPPLLLELSPPVLPPAQVSQLPLQLARATNSPASA